MKLSFLTSKKAGYAIRGYLPLVFFSQSYNSNRGVKNNAYEIRLKFKCPEQENIITIFSDKAYMDSLYNKLLFIKAMQKEEEIIV